MGRTINRETALIARLREYEDRTDRDSPAIQARMRETRHALRRELQRPLRERVAGALIYPNAVTPRDQITWLAAGGVAIHPLTVAQEIKHPGDPAGQLEATMAWLVTRAHIQLENARAPLEHGPAARADRLAIVEGMRR